MSDRVETPDAHGRSTAALAALFAWPLLLLLDTAVALLRGWEPRTVASRAGIAAWIGTAGLAAAAAALPAGRRLLERVWAPLILLVVSLSLAWLAAEILVWAFPQVLGSSLAHSRGPNVHRVFRPDPRWIHGVYGESRYTTSSLGIRGGPLPVSRAVERILCVGGSTTECAYLDDDETWTHLLMTELAARSGRPVWVGGLGIAGYTTFEHLDFLRSSAAVHNFDRVVLLVGINDLVRTLNGSLEMGPPPLWRRSPLLNAALTSLKRRSLHTLLYDAEDPTGANVEARRRIRRQAGIRTAPPDLRPALRDYGERIAGLAAACRRRGVRCLFATQPVLWRADLGPRERDSLWMGSDDAGRFYDPGTLRHGMDLYNAALLAACSRLSLDCVDLSASMSGREEYFYDDCHYTEAGARELAHLLAGHLLAEKAEASP